MAPAPEEAGLAMIGFGEAGMAFVDGWRDEGPPRRIAAYDIKTDSAHSREAMRARYASHGIDGCETVADALHDACLVFCVVTADQALAAARAAAPALAPGTLWFDCNSCAPGTKAAAAETIEAAGGRYVDVAVMAPVHPGRHHVPLLVSGPHASAAVAALSALGMRPREAGPEVGQASSVKMLRSVMIKGLEALCAECFLSARLAGVEDQVLASLEASDPDIRWRQRATYTLDRMLVHGARRAAEMREVVRTVDALGLPPGMSMATAEWQDWMAALALDPGPPALESRLDRVLARVPRGDPDE